MDVQASVRPLGYAPGLGSFKVEEDVYGVFHLLSNMCRIFVLSFA